MQSRLACLVSLALLLVGTTSCGSRTTPDSAFLEDLAGRVLVAPSAPDRPFRCRVEVDGPKNHSGRYPCRVVLRIDLTGDSYALGDELTLYEGAPLPRR